MKKPMFTIHIVKSKGEYFWRIIARNGKKCGTTGERHKRKSYVLKRVALLFRDWPIVMPEEK